MIKLFHKDPKMTVKIRKYFNDNKFELMSHAITGNVIRTKRNEEYKKKTRKIKVGLLLRTFKTGEARPIMKIINSIVV